MIVMFNHNKNHIVTMFNVYSTMIAQHSPSWFICTMPIMCPPPVTDLVLINSCSTTITLSCFVSFLHVIWLFLFMFFSMGPIGRQLSSYIGPSISVYTYILYYFVHAEIVNKFFFFFFFLSSSISTSST